MASRIFTAGRTAEATPEMNIAHRVSSCSQGTRENWSLIQVVCLAELKTSRSETLVTHQLLTTYACVRFSMQQGTDIFLVRLENQMHGQ